MSTKLQRTRHYSLFVVSKQNRPVDDEHVTSGHRRLRDSMAKYGFLPAFPIMVKPQAGKLVIIDGQHRYTIAKELQLEVFYVEDNTTVDVTEVNAAQSKWTLRDFVNRWANAEKADYKRGLAFSDEYKVPLGDTFAMLADLFQGASALDQIRNGTYKITDFKFAERVASNVDAMAGILGFRNNRLLQAVWLVSHIENFDDDRFMHGLRRVPHLISRSATVDDYLVMLDHVYNYSRRNVQPIAAQAQEWRRERKAKSIDAATAAAAVTRKKQGAKP